MEQEEAIRRVASQAIVRQLLDAGNDSNGNPRRRCVIYGKRLVLASIDMGYSNLPKPLQDIPAIPTVYVRNLSELRDFDKAALYDIDAV